MKQILNFLAVKGLWLFAALATAVILWVADTKIRNKYPSVLPPAVEVTLNQVTTESESPAKTELFADEPGDDDEVRKVKSYIRRFKVVALQEKKKYGIPASVKMAQAILESNAGRSKLSNSTNNHFGIKCFSRTCKKGHCSNFGDDTHKDFFRKYDSAWESWRAHSKLIANGKYKTLLKHGDDYRSWAHGLKKLGYATAKHYDQTLINLIEKYQLYKLDGVDITALAATN